MVKYVHLSRALPCYREYRHLGGFQKNPKPGSMAAKPRFHWVCSGSRAAQKRSICPHNPLVVGSNPTGPIRHSSSRWDELWRMSAEAETRQMLLTHLPALPSYLTLDYPHPYRHVWAVFLSLWFKMAYRLSPVPAFRRCQDDASSVKTLEVIENLHRRPLDMHSAGAGMALSHTVCESYSPGERR